MVTTSTATTITMGSPRIPPVPRPVYLKASCDLQLEAAFTDKRWADVANLAQKRFKSTKDKYYHAIEIAAKCQGDNIVDRSAGLVEIEKLLKESKITEDIDSLDLYEFACSETQTNYTDNFGALRSRMVRASPKDHALGLRCFDACIWNLDWKHAQEIAASMDKNFVKERKFLFRNILTTFLFSQSSGIAENTQKLFSNLAKAHADKALKLRVPAVNSQGQPHRAIIAEEELLMWLDIRLANYTRLENAECLSQPQTSPLTFLELGFTRTYHFTLNYLEQVCEAWDEVLRIGRHILEVSIDICRKETSAIEASQNDAGEEAAKAKISQAIQRVKDGRSVKEQRYLAASCEMPLWVCMVSAAKHQPDSKSELKKVSKLVNKIIRALEPLEGARGVFQKNRDLLELKIVFARDSRATRGPADAGFSTRVVHLAKHVERHCTDPACFRSVKPMIAELSQSQLAEFLGLLKNNSTDDTDKLKRLVLLSMRLKIRYLQATSVKYGELCEFCHGQTQGPDCMACVKSILLNALDSFSSAVQDEDILRVKETGQEDPLANLTMIGSTCLLKLSGVGDKSWNPKTNSPLFNTDLQLFLQAVLWTEYYVAIKPTNNALRLLLVKLYLLMGCASRAKSLWDGFDIKNAILNSLASLFFDRLSTISPGDFNQGLSRTPVGPIKTYFSNAVRRHLPSALTNAIENENYGSFIDEVHFVDRLARSCTIVMAVVEERRGLRMRSGKCERAIEDEPLIGNYTIEHQLNDPTDYGYLPVLAAAGSEPLQEMISYGPLPTNDRSQLSILAERFVDIVCPVQTKDYKPTKSSQAILSGWQHTISVCHKIREDMGLFFANNALELVLTGPEYWYFRIVWQLADIIKVVLEHGITAQATGETRDAVKLRIKQVLEDLGNQAREFLTLPAHFPSKIHTFQGMTALHAMGMLRESALVVKHTALYLTAAFDRIKVVDKSRGSNNSTWLASDLKKMTVAATESEGQIKSRIKLLNERLNTSGWMDRLEDWTFAGWGTVYNPHNLLKEQVAEGLQKFIPQTHIEDWTMNITDSWRENLRGWGAIKFD
ncbi:N-acetyltransferase B complex non catalytic subunit-domain-containing protein [Biscogniauxia marginata]|nr:N-acetyltransferase B complex non catalytic subunit-domain-containing protein [Biscogniauxia marginata]